MKTNIMKKALKPLTLFLTLFILIISFFQLQAQEPWERNIRSGKEKVRVISYNILDGFSWKKDTDRMDRFVSWMQEKDPEIVALQELNSFNQADLEILAKRYGHPYAMILKESGYSVGLTSKKPIKLKKRILDSLCHGALHASTYGIDMVLIHLHPGEWMYRAREARLIANYIEEQKLESYMVMGDFNAHSPYDADDLEMRIPLIREYLIRDCGRDDKTTNLRDGRFDYSVLSTFLSLQMEDVCRMFIKSDQRITFPTRLYYHRCKNEWVHSGRGERIDYILTSPNLLKDCVEAMIWNGEDTDYLSDHYPVGIDILLDVETK